VKKQETIMKPQPLSDELPMDTVMDDLKIEINEFLFQRLPDQTTLAEFEIMAVNIYQMIDNKWKESEEA